MKYILKIITLQKILGNIKEVIKFIFVYGIVKVLSFIAPLFLSTQIQIEDYGRFEYLLSVSTTLSMVLDMGFASAYPFFVLKLGDVDSSVFFKNHLLLFSSLIFILSIILVLSDNTELAAIIVSSILLVIQYFLSSMFKTQSRKYFGLLSDGIFFYSINFLNLLIYFSIIKYSLSNMLIILIIYLLIIVLSLFQKNKNNLKWLKIKQYSEIFKVSKGFLVTGFLSLLFLNLPRIMMNFYTNAADIGVYSFFFRITYFSIILFQIFNIYFFKKIYTSSSQIIDNYFSKLLLVIVTFTGFILLASIFVMEVYPSKFTVYRSNNISLLIILCFQSIFWITNAFYDGIFGREGIINLNNYILIGVISLLFILIKSVNYFIEIDISAILVIHFFGYVFLTQIQFWVLRKQGVKLYKTQKVNLLILSLFLIVIFSKICV